jgi:sigma-E factor negative regulatory protein RseB
MRAAEATSESVASRRRTTVCAAMLGLLAALALAPHARAEDAMAWLARAAHAARTLNYVGTIVFQHGGRTETLRLTHVNDGGAEYEKLVNLDGPAREVIRSHGEVRCYYPDAKIVRVEPRTFRNVFPSLSPQQQRSLAEHYEFRKAENVRVAGFDAEVHVLEPKDGRRYGHRFWTERETGLLLKARMINERQEVVEQFAFTDIAIGVKLDRELAKPTWPAVPPDWQLREGAAGEPASHDTGWVVAKLPPGFVKVKEGFRHLRGRREQVAHLVFSDGLVAVSVFVEPIAAVAGQAAGAMRQGGLNVYAHKMDDHLVTALGEAPPITIRQIAQSVSRQSRP